MEDIILAIDSKDAVLEDALPIKLVSSCAGIIGLRRILPLVLDALDFIIHAEHDMTTVLVLIILVDVIVGIVEIRVDGVLVVDIFVVVIPVKSSRPRSRIRGTVVRSRRLRLGASQRDHEPAALHSLSSGRYLRMKHVVDFDTTKLGGLATVVLVYQNAETTVSIPSPIHLGRGRLLLLLLLLLGSLLRRNTLLILLLGTTLVLSGLLRHRRTARPWLLALCV